jgi:DNA ligase-associated metallophosphoesterase
MQVDVSREPAGEAMRRLEDPREKTVLLAGHLFHADPSGALYWPDERLLIVADLHFEKGSAYATRRVFLPPYDTRASLTRLAGVIARLKPKRVVALGDSFHDRQGAARLRDNDRQMLRELQVGRDWVWIAGNHDPADSVRFEGDHAAELSLGQIILRHEPSTSDAPGEIAGHLHPVALVGGRGGALRRRCFVTDGRRCILPAFGAYAGGLNITDPAFATFLAASYRAFVLGRDLLYEVSARQCLREARALAYFG